MEKKNIVDSELEKAEKAILMEMFKTEKKKENFINEIKSGLGEEMKRNPSKVTIIKKSFLNRCLSSIKKIFTKF